jgi:hypothetical protein
MAPQTYNKEIVHKSIINSQCKSWDKVNIKFLCSYNPSTRHYIVVNKKLTLYFFIKSSTVLNSLCTCLNAILYCTNNLEHEAVYLQKKYSSSNCIIFSFAKQFKTLQSINIQTPNWCWINKKHSHLRQGK